MTTAHTPGPWHIFACQGDHGASTVICEADGYTLAKIPTPAWDKTRKDYRTKQDRANAHPIAAAPDLLRELDALLDDWEDALTTHIFDEDNLDKEGRQDLKKAQSEVQRIRAIIAQAKGGN